MENQSNHLRWGTSVAIHIGSGNTEYIHDANEALTYLHARWPLLDGPHMENAKLRCIDALGHNGSPTLAREAFIAAAIEADVLS